MARVPIPKSLLVILCVFSGLFLLGTTFVLVRGSQIDAHKKAYLAKLEQLKVNAAEVSSDTSNFKMRMAFTEKELQDALLDRYRAIIDSLGLTDKVRGSVTNLDLRPSDITAGMPASSRIDFFLSCDCEQKGMYDFLSIEVDPASFHARVSNLTPSMTLEQYITLTAERR